MESTLVLLYAVSKPNIFGVFYVQCVIAHAWHESSYKPSVQTACFFGGGSYGFVFYYRVNVYRNIYAVNM